MLFNLATLTLPLFLLGHFALSSPLDARAPEDAGLKAVDAKIDQVPAPVPVVADSISGKVQLVAGKTTSANTGFDSLLSGVDRLTVCAGSRCDGNCVSYALSDMRSQVCYASHIAFRSTAIYQPSNAGLPYAIYAGAAGCANLAQVPRVNTCYYSSTVRSTFIRT